MANKLYPHSGPDDTHDRITVVVAVVAKDDATATEDLGAEGIGKGDRRRPKPVATHARHHLTNAVAFKDRKIAILIRNAILPLHARRIVRRESVAVRAASRGRGLSTIPVQGLSDFHAALHVTIDAFTCIGIAFNLPHNLSCAAHIPTLSLFHFSWIAGILRGKRSKKIVRDSASVLGMFHNATHRLSIHVGNEAIHNARHLVLGVDDVAIAG